ncbi:hypothetical protein APS56_06155 [Pseudalgibacter alginicilyticus]|uniref:FAS1 domain-containing protein n=1 Tax=Pseudalgibacter alginicilyticus TaxID=1736674 RepID=A0A0P0D3U1_9FLAO|nr:hypothetical protein APS56_06155 [Pseudalgibacter alginicilyticus]
MSENSEYSIFVTLLEQTGYKSQLQTSQAFTVWAPNNAAFAQVSSAILNDPDALKELIGNHISLFSYNTSSNQETLVKMFNDKYIEFINTSGISTFGGINLATKDILTSNGILHTINEVLEVSPNIWGYLNTNASEYPSLMAFLTQFNETVFDEGGSVKIGTNSLGQSVYDSVFVSSNSYFKTIGDLSSEERRYSFIGLTEQAYTGIYDTFKDYYYYPVADSIKANTDRTIFSNLNFPAVDIDDLNGNLVTTTGNSVNLDPNAITENLALSNGNVFVVDELNYDPKNVIYKEVFYEIENTDRRTIGNATALTVQKRFNRTSSGQFYSVVNLNQNPDAGETNNYFEISFSNVLSASYTLHLKFVPIGASKNTNLKFQLSYTDENKNTIVDDIPSVVINNQEDGEIQIGGTYDIPVFINEQKANSYFVKLKIFVDVSESQLILFDRTFGLDYAKLVPTE